MRNTLFAALLLATGARAEVPALRQLEENARYWDERGRADQAAAAWQKILRSDPAHEAALAELAEYNARRGDDAVARGYAARLRAAHPRSARLPAVERAIAVGERFDPLLAEARARAGRGEAEAAVTRYREAFGDAPPAGRLALEFYQTLGGTEAGWAEARAGLERLAAATPGDPLVRLALAELLTWREDTRRDGIRRLSELRNVPAVAERAAKAERQALLWLDARPADRLLLEASLAGRDDPALEARLAGLKQRRPEPGAAAWRALEAGELDAAERHFETWRAQAPRDARPLGGLATVALRREDFPRARALLERARRLAPGAPQIWERSLASARFWELVREAELLRDEGQTTTAIERLEEAMRVAPVERPHAELALAEVHRRRGDTAAAERVLRGLLAREANHRGALQALVVVLLARGEVEGAVAVNERLAQVAPEAAREAAWLQAEALRLRAAERTAVDDLGGALMLLESAHAEHPTHVEVLLDTAAVHGALEAPGKARQVMDALLKLAPDRLDVRLADARLCSDEGQPARGLARLAELPPDAVTPEARALRRRLEAERAAAAAVAQAARGERTPARRALEALTRQARDDEALLAVAARAWSAIGDHERAVKILRAALVRARTPQPGLRLQLAAVLLETGPERRLLAQLDALGREPGLDARQRRGVKRLWIAHAVRRAHALRAEGETNRARRYLQPLLEEHPEDRDLLGALGWLLLDDGSLRKARGTFLRVLEETPRDLDARSGAVQASVALGDLEGARALVESLLQDTPDDPRAHLLAGRFALMAGDDGQAMKALERARDLAEQPLVAGPGAPAVPEAVQVEIEKEINDLEARRSPGVVPALSLRHRDGESGLGFLVEYAAPIRAEVPVGYHGRARLTVTPVLLDAGDVALDDPAVAERFGSGAARAESLPQNAGGVAVGLAYAWRGLLVDLGTTPLGFPVQSMVGGVRWETNAGGLGLAVEASRRPVRDSLLSWAGTVDPGTGRTWGGVLAQGARLEVSHTAGDFVTFAFGDGRWLTGDGVPDNTGGTAGLGLEWTLNEADDSVYAVGLLASGSGYRHNLSRFTLGHGGYFSPQAFLHLGTPARWRGRYARFDWNLVLQPGINAVREDPVDVFPDDPTRQSDRAAAGGLTRHPGRSAVGFAFDGDLALEYRPSPAFGAQLGLSIHTAEDYQELLGRLAFQFDFVGAERLAAERE